MPLGTVIDVRLGALGVAATDSADPGVSPGVLWAAASDRALDSAIAPARWGRARVTAEWKDASLLRRYLHVRMLDVEPAAFASEWIPTADSRIAPLGTMTMSTTTTCVEA